MTARAATAGERSPVVVRLVGVVGMLLFGSIISVVLIFGLFAAILGLLLLITSPSAWAPLLGAG